MSSPKDIRVLYTSSIGNRASVHELLHHCVAVPSKGFLKRSPAIVIFHVRVGTSIQQLSRNTCMATLGHDVKRRGEFLGDP